MSTQLVGFYRLCRLQPARSRRKEPSVATPRELLNQAKAAIREATPDEVEPKLGQVALLDVREADEYEQGALPGAVHVPRGHLEFQVEGRLPDKSHPVVVYCAGGVRSAFA